MRHKILLIDDNHDTLDLLELLLYKSFEIVTAMNGFEGLKKAQEEKPHLIITDIMMPIMDGIRFYNNLKKEESIKKTPVIATSSFLKKITYKSLLNMGFNGVVSKPVKREEVFSAIEKILADKNFSSNANEALNS
ncbi:response regulator [Chitinispirillales bacterium ANBcel5]|uniref:response regulator n=1 Tax=Cellulosispirillum alkaliphilum TaxID=3039283 RepID=UPI002A4F2D7D|nr:response regulator [Chitinispirillales bacterium ANBcel5]